MHKFADNAGRGWLLQITPGGLRDVKTLCGVDLGAMAAEPGLVALGELVGDIPSLVDVIYCLCRPMAERRGMSDEDFGRALVPERFLAGALSAFLAALADHATDPELARRLARHAKRAKKAV